MPLQQRLSDIQQVIEGRSPAPTIVATSKYATDAQVLEAYDAGLRHFGESRLQAALDRMVRLPKHVRESTHWHFIGHVQRNKAAKTVSHFSLIHTVDSLRLAQKLSEANLAAGQCQRVLLQVNIAKNPGQHGFSEAAVTEAFPTLVRLQGLCIEGLMAMGPVASVGSDGVAAAEAVRGVFQSLARLREAFQSRFHHALPELSMGMSQDYAHAVDSGATMLRIGRLLFHQSSD